MTLSKLQIQTIIRNIEPELEAFAAKYDERKYPPGELVRLRGAFKSASGVLGNDFEAALVWKFGHTGKANYPDHHRRLATRLNDLWQSGQLPIAADPAGTFDTWRQALGPTSYITVCFLLHLIWPKEVPIIDQHNFRAMKHHLLAAGTDAKLKAKPGTYADVALLREFIDQIMRHWESSASSKTPSSDKLDRYLMMFGKELKRRKKANLPA